MPIRTLIIALVAVAALAGCGRKGPLEDPPPKPVVATPLAAGAAPAAAPAPAPARPHRFPLDFLL